MKPIIRWEWDGQTVAATDRWVTMRCSGMPPLRLEGDELLGLAETLRQAHYRLTHPYMPAGDKMAVGDLTVDYHRGHGRIYLRGRGTEIALNPQVAGDLQHWLAHLTKSRALANFRLAGVGIRVQHLEHAALLKNARETRVFVPAELERLAGDLLAAVASESARLETAGGITVTVGPDTAPHWIAGTFIRHRRVTVDGLQVGRTALAKFALSLLGRSAKERLPAHGRTPLPPGAS